MIGSWLDLDFDWRRRHVIYHGWNRPGWVNHARPYVHIRNVYVQRSRPYINQRWRHDPSHGDPAGYWASRPPGGAVGRYPHTPEVRGRGPAPTGTQGGAFVPGSNARQSSNRGRESLRTVSPRPAPQRPGIITQPTPQAPAVSPRPAPQAPTVTTRPAPRVPTFTPGPTPQPPTVSQRLAPQAPVTIPRSTPPAPSVSPRAAPEAPAAFGGYRGPNEARTQSVRGQESRQSTSGGHAPPSPAGRGGVPAGGGTRGGARP
jgi:hypothetical protein